MHLVVGQPQPAAAGTALCASFVRVAYLAILIQCALGRVISGRCNFFPKLHVLVGELFEALLAIGAVGALALGLLHGGHQGRDGEPHDEADEEVDPREPERARVRAAEPEPRTDLLGLPVPELAKPVAFPSEEVLDLAILGVVAGLVLVGELSDRLRREVTHRVGGARVRVWSGLARRVSFSPLPVLLNAKCNAHRLTTPQGLPKEREPEREFY